MHNNDISLGRLSLGSQDIGVTSISDGHHGNSVELSASSAEVVVVTRVVVDSALGKHSVVLNLRLSQGGSVGGDDNHLGLASAQSLDGGLVTQSSLSRLHHQLKLAVDGLNNLLRLLTSRSRGHFLYYQLLRKTSTDVCCAVCEAPKTTVLPNFLGAWSFVVNGVSTHSFSGTGFNGRDT